MAKATIIHTPYENAWIGIEGTPFKACVTMKEAEVALAFIRSGGADEVNIFFDCEEVFASFDRRRISYCRIEDFAAPRAEGSASNWGFIKFRDNGTVEKILENACSENGEQFVECDIEEVR